MNKKKEKIIFRNEYNSYFFFFYTLNFTVLRVRVGRKLARLYSKAYIKCKWIAVRRQVKPIFFVYIVKCIAPAGNGQRFSKYALKKISWGVIGKYFY